MSTSRRDSFDEDDQDDRPVWREPGDAEPFSSSLSDRDDPLESDLNDPTDDDAAYDTCPYCKKLIHEDADLCPHCQSFVHFDDSAPRPWWIWTGAGLGLLGVLTAAGLCAALWYLK